MIVVSLTACASRPQAAAPTPTFNLRGATPLPPTLRVITEYIPGQPIAKNFVMRQCGGQNVSPRVQWFSPPPGTKSFVLTMTDSQESGAAHWILADIPASTTMIPTNAAAHPKAAYGRLARNSFNHRGYDGPCPPRKSLHTYVVTLYALNVPHLPIEAPQEVQTMMAGHVLAEATTIAQYAR